MNMLNDAPAPTVIFLQGSEIKTPRDLPNHALALELLDGRQVVMDRTAMRFVAAQLERIDDVEALGNRSLSAALVPPSDPARLRAMEECPEARADRRDPRFLRGVGGRRS
jgi:hypothetical protein